MFLKRCLVLDKTIFILFFWLVFDMGCPFVWLFVELVKELALIVFLFYQGRYMYGFANGLDPTRLPGATG